jgi:hypothetical protein
MSFSDVCSYYEGRLRCTAKGGIGAVCGWVSLFFGAIAAISAWRWPEWAKSHISDHLNIIMQGLIPLAVGASWLWARWVASSYLVYRNAMRDVDEDVADLRTQLANTKALLDDQRRYEEVRDYLSRSLIAIDKFTRICNDPEQIVPIEAITEWEIKTSIYIRENLGEADENRFRSEAGVEHFPTSKFVDERAIPLRTLHYRSRQLLQILDRLDANRVRKEA